MNDKRRAGGASIGIGAVLVALGVLFLLEQLFGFQLGQWLWSLFIIIPGLFCFVGMVLGGKSAGPLAIPGSIITTVGLLLFYQNTFDHFESWAYAWALIPIAVGIGLMINGAWSDHPTLVQNGRRLAGIGLVLFLVGFFFFELVLNIGRWASGLVAPLLLITAGIYLLLRRVSPAGRPTTAPEAVTAAPDEVALPVSSLSAAAPLAPAAAEPVGLPRLRHPMSTGTGVRWRRINKAVQCRSSSTTSGSCSIATGARTAAADPIREHRLVGVPPGRAGALRAALPRRRTGLPGHRPVGSGGGLAAQLVGRRRGGGGCAA